MADALVVGGQKWIRGGWGAGALAFSEAGIARIRPALSGWTGVEDATVYDGFVLLGCVIRGETTHYDIVAYESAREIMRLATERRLALGNGILTVENGAQAWARARTSEKDKGGAAAQAALHMIALKRRFGLAAA